MLATPTLDTPQRIDRYLVFGAFARGGTANVHLARLEASAGLSRVVAIKRVDPNVVTDPRMAERLLEEARLLFRVRHACVVSMLDVVRHGEELCLVLEYVHGISLAALLEHTQRAGETMPPGVAVAITADLVRGLHAAHEARDADGRPLGIVHRDVSPQNVIVALDGSARVLDFGVAKALGREKLTVTGTTLGKVVYMAPEQLKALPLSAQADLYSAGVVLWECLTGRSFADALAGGEATPSKIVPGLPVALDHVVAKALSRETRLRYASGEEFAADLEEACSRATTTDVARFVERLASDELDRRAELVAHVERFIEEIAPESAENAPQKTPRRTWRARTWTGAAIVSMVVAIASTVLMTRTAARADTASDFIATTSPPVSVPHEVADLDDEVRAAPRPPPLPEPIIAPAALTERVERVRPAPRVVAKPRPLALAAASPCDPPFRIESDGRKRYKTECLR